MREVVNAILYVLKTGIKRHIIVDADGGYWGKVVKQFVHRKGLKLKVIKKAKNGFNVLQRSWVVERSFAWLGGFRV